MQLSFLAKTKTPRTVRQARAKGLAAAARAGRHADAKLAQWVTRACVFVLGYAQTYHADKSAFLIEDAREFAEQSGLTAPPDPRAWGQAAQQLQRRGELVSAGYAPARSSNGSPKVQWRLS